MSRPGNGGNTPTVNYNSIEISEDLINEIGYRLFGNAALFGEDPFRDSVSSWGAQIVPYFGSTINTQQMNLLSNYNLTNHGTTLCLMSGDMPSSVDDLVIADYLPQVLWSCSSMPTGSGDQSKVFNLSKLDKNPISLSTNYYPAVADGNANWLLFYCSYYNSALAGVNPTAIHSFMGTVGMPNTGCDLDLPDTYIVSGKMYSIRNLKIQLPTLWNFITV